MSGQMKPRCGGFISELPELTFWEDLTLTVRTKGASAPRDFVPPSTRSLHVDSRVA